MTSAPDYAASINVDRNAADVFLAITDVRRWWTGEIDGDSTQLGDEFSYRYPGYHFSQQRLVELVPGERIVWRIIDSHLDGYDDPQEWTGTELRFELVEVDGGTVVNFSHHGLTPQVECFDNCASGWEFYLHGSLHRWLTTGEGPMTPPWATETPA